MAYEKEIKAIGEAGKKLLKGIKFTVSVSTSAFIVSMEKVRIHMFPIRYQFHKELHRKITNKGK